MLRRRLPNIPVLFLETGYHFAETNEFRDRLTKEWQLNLVNVIPRKTVAQQEAELGILYRMELTKCCQLRKVDRCWMRGAVRLVHGAAARTITHTEKSEEGGAASPAGRQNTFESESAGRLDVGTSVGVHEREGPELFAAI